MGAVSTMLNREQLRRLLDEVSSELRHERVRAQVYVIGGAAMSLAFSRDRRTEDIDARIDRGHSALVKAVQRVGRRHGIADNWLNEQATTAIPETADHGAQTLYESSYLTVTGASAKHLLAMKLYSAREKDRQDIATLVDELKLRTREEAAAIYRNLFPDEPLKARAQALLEMVFPGKTLRAGGDARVQPGAASPPGIERNQAPGRGVP